MTEKNSDSTFTLSLPEMSSFKLTKTQIREFIQLIEERSNTNPLFSMADKIQANSAIQSALILNGLYETLQDDGLEGNLDDVSKLVTLIIKANANINNTFKQLAISSDSREEEVDTDPLSRMLRELNLENFMPPMLKEHYIRAKDDIKAVEKGGILGENQTEQEKKKMLEDIKTPIKSWVDIPKNSGKEEVVDLEVEGADGL